MFNIPLAIFILRLLVCSLLGWWVPLFPRRVTLLEVRMSCRFVSSSMFQCYSWRSAWRKLSILPWFFFESPCLGFCLWCCISVPGRRSFQRSWSECCWYIGVSVSIITFVFDLFIFRPWLSVSSANSCSICCSSCGVLAHMSMSSAKQRWLSSSLSIVKNLVSRVSRRNMHSSAVGDSLGVMVFPCESRLLSWLVFDEFLL